MVLMPTGDEGPPPALDILVQNDPGTQADPVLVAGGGAYYETRGRPVRIPVLAAQGQSAGFVPRTRLGISLSIVSISSASSIPVPGTQLSASLASLSSTDAGPTISVPTFADPSGQPAIRLQADADNEGEIFLVSLEIMEAKDEDRDPTGV